MGYGYGLFWTRWLQSPVSYWLDICCVYTYVYIFELDHISLVAEQECFISQYFISLRMSSFTWLHKAGIPVWEMNVSFGNSYCLSTVSSIFSDVGCTAISLAVCPGFSASYSSNLLYSRVSVSVWHFLLSRLYLSIPNCCFVLRSENWMDEMVMITMSLQVSCITTFGCHLYLTVYGCHQRLTLFLNKIERSAPSH